LINTSFGFGLGVSTSRSSSTSGGPGSRAMLAFTRTACHRAAYAWASIWMLAELATPETAPGEVA
jgi:hypothetical protein